jgi:hypothetical protein
MSYMAKEISLTGPCPDCGKNLALVGRSHICRPTSPTGLKIARVRPLDHDPNKSKSADDGIEFQSMAHPPGLIDELANAIMSGKLSLKKRGRPRKTGEGFDKAAWQRDYMRKRRAEGKK